MQPQSSAIATSAYREGLGALHRTHGAHAAHPEPAKAARIRAGRQRWPPQDAQQGQAVQAGAAASFPEVCTAALSCAVQSKPSIIILISCWQHHGTSGPHREFTDAVCAVQTSACQHLQVRQDVSDEGSLDRYLTRYGISRSHSKLQQDNMEKDAVSTCVGSAVGHKLHRQGKRWGQPIPHRRYSSSRECLIRRPQASPLRCLLGRCLPSLAAPQAMP